MTSRTLTRSVFTIALALGAVSPSWAERPVAGDALAAAVARAAGVEAFEQLHHLRFTWEHLPSGRVREFDWDLDRESVTVTRGEETVVVPAGGTEDEALRDAHAAFVNDNYWLLFELHLAWDDEVTFETLGSREVPGFPELGELLTLAVHYTGDGGYTPGDTYVLYLGSDDLPLAWAYHPKGAEEPRLVTTRGERKKVAGLDLPTTFLLPDGSTFIRITGIVAE